MIDISNLTKDIVDSSVKNLFALDQYKELGGAIGGWYPVSATVWGTVSAFAMAGWDTIEMILRGAFSVAAALAGALVDFIADLTDILAIIAADADQVLAGAVQGANIAGQAVIAVSAPMLAAGAALLDSTRPGRSGGGDRDWSIFGVVIVAVAAVALTAVTFGTAASIVVTGGAIVGGFVLGGTLAAVYGGTTTKVARTASNSRTAGNLGLSGGRR